MTGTEHIDLAQGKKFQGETFQAENSSNLCIFTQILPETVYFWKRVETHFASRCPAHIKNILL